MKIIIEGKNSQIPAIVLMLQGFGVSITDEAGNSLISKKLPVSRNQDAIEQAETITANLGSTIKVDFDGSGKPEETAEFNVVEIAETQQPDEERAPEETAEVKNKNKNKKK